MLPIDPKKETSIHLIFLNAMPSHHFDPNLATKYSIDQAIILSYLWENIKRNIAHKSQYFEGQYWSKETKLGLLDLFPYFTEIKLESILKRLTENKLIISKDSTKKPEAIWLALTQEALEYFQNGTQITRKTTTKKPVIIEKFSEIKNFELYTKSSDAKYFIIAYKFWKIWINENPKSFTLKNAEVAKWITALKLIVEKDKQELRRLIGIYVYFNKCAANESGYDKFWFETIKSLSAFRKKDRDDVYYLDRIIDKVNKKIEQSDQFYKDILAEEQKIYSKTQKA